MPDEYDVLLRDGGIAHLRPLRPDDGKALHGLVDRSSERSAHLRFFAGGTASAHRYMDTVAAPGYRGHALVATVHGQVVGIAEYIPDDDGDEAEMAILLDDAVHGHGLGTLLLEHLALDAADHQVRVLVGDVLPENNPMIHMLRDLGMDVKLRFDDGVAKLRISLPPTAHLQMTIDSRDHQAERASLTRVLSPRSVAVIGASRDPSGVGHRVLRNLIDAGFPGPIYPVNPKADQVAGLTAFPDMHAVPAPVDLVVVAVPALNVLDVARDCAAVGITGLVVLTSGFAEGAQPGAEKELLRICRAAGIRLVGPNCLGVVNTAARLNASFLSAAPATGRIGMLSQSGAVAAAVLDRLATLGTGVSSFVSVGNKADVSGNDLLEYWEDDPDTDVIALYLESFGNPRKFTRIARRVGARKPVLLVKSGRSDAGGRAVRSHTAAAATPDAAVDALVEASGVIRVDSVQDLLDTARLFAAQPLPHGRRVAIVGNSGGPEAMAADACERHGLIVAELAAATQRKLSQRPSAAVGNPVDLTADAETGEFALAIEALLADAEVDIVLVVYTPPFGSGREKTEQVIATATQHTDKTVLACVVGHDALIDGRIPSYAFPEQAAGALTRVVHYAERRKQPVEETAPARQRDVLAARELVRAGLDGHPDGRWLEPSAATRLLRCYGLDVTDSVEADGPQSAAEAAELVGLPAVVKATGPELVHKSDVGGVRVGLTTSDDVRQAYRDMAESVGPVMTGAIVQRMLPSGVEIIIGGVNYPTFGPLVMIGMGGVTADLLADRAFRVTPLTTTSATRMIAELRCAPLLYGYRGSLPVDTAALTEQLIGVGQLLEDLPEVAELDLNPVIVTRHGATTVDVRIRLSPAPPITSPLRRHLR
ncbi:bifunctional acetate--CoA ligase family protein/GNAT family N-acetyltransferase [Nonomuraea sp. LPB2021202275-12-8]|uniref:bifunctional acetate--CoA ligase family protein/GNAT family N-acetyltransferase n=1 Tax=Nonomuraea sp. LPB2021202275-12-8 TaxID=3120159 RepID=UPI00300D22F3